MLAVGRDGCIYSFVFCPLTCIILIVLFYLFYRCREHCYHTGTSVMFERECHIKGPFLHVVQSEYFLTTQIDIIFDIF